MAREVSSSTASGISFGAAMAITISWAKWHSFWWMLLHGLFGWTYVAYYFIMGY